MCSLCKQTGQWDQLKAKLMLTKTKKAKIKENLEDSLSQAEQIGHALEQIRQNTKELKLLSEEEFLGILNKFRLPPVSTMFN